MMNAHTCDGVCSRSESGENSRDYDASVVVVVVMVVRRHGWYADHDAQDDCRSPRNIVKVYSSHEDI